MAELRQIFRCEIGCFKNGFMRHPYFQQAAGNFEFAFITTFLSALLETLLFTYRQSVSVMSRRPYLRGGGIPSDKNVHSPLASFCKQTLLINLNIIFEYGRSGGSRGITAGRADDECGRAAY